MNIENIDFKDQKGKSKIVLIDTNIISEKFKDNQIIDAFCKKVKEKGGIVFIAPQVLKEVGMQKKNEDENIKRVEVIKYLVREKQARVLSDLPFVIKKEIEDVALKKIPVFSDKYLKEVLKDVKGFIEKLKVDDKKLNEKADPPGDSDKEKEEVIKNQISGTKEQIKKDEEICKDFKENGYNFYKAEYFSCHSIFLEKIIYEKLICSTLTEKLEATLTYKNLEDIKEKTSCIKEKIILQDCVFRELSNKVLLKKQVDDLIKRYSEDFFKEVKYPFLKTYVSIGYYNQLMHEDIKKIRGEKFVRCRKNQWNDDLFLPFCFYSKFFITNDEKLEERSKKLKTILEIPMQKKEIPIQTFEKFMAS